MKIDKIAFRGFTCFQKEWVDFSDLKPINVIIGRNNTGKSHLLDFVEGLCGENPLMSNCSFRCEGITDQASLISEMRKEKNQLSPLFRAGNPENITGIHSGKAVTWEIDFHRRTFVLDFEKFDYSYLTEYKELQKRLIQIVLTSAKHDFSKRRFRRLRADRDIVPEPENDRLATLQESGGGASQIIRDYIVRDDLPRELIKKYLFDAMKLIFGPDGKFLELEIQQNHQGGQRTWEVFFNEEDKKQDLVPLSKSGSGLKTIILVLLNLLVVPEMPDEYGKINEKNQFVFAFEELENNLHPALLRRLFQYLLDYVRREKCTLFLTTHSSVALDFFGACEDAQFIHVSRKDDTSVAKVVNAHFDKLGVLSELGAKPSDLLQANGIVWVEGPSDRIYLNKWISLFSDEQLQEGRDYQCAFYGGALLADLEVKDPASQVDEMVNLIRVNPNIILVCDSDRTSEDTPLKDAVARIEQECKGVNCAMNWILDAKEIENYLPGSILEKVYGKTNLPDPDQLMRFFPSEKDGETSYLEKEVGRKTPQKMKLALKASRLMTLENMSGRFDLAEKMTEIVAKIREWNR